MDIHFIAFKRSNDSNSIIFIFRPIDLKESIVPMQLSAWCCFPYNIKCNSLSGSQLPYVCNCPRAYLHFFQILISPKIVSVLISGIPRRNFLPVGGLPYYFIAYYIDYRLFNTFNT